MYQCYHVCDDRVYDKQKQINNYNNTSLAAPGALAHRLQNPKWLAGSGKVYNPRFSGASVNLHKQ